MHNRFIDDGGQMVGFLGCYTVACPACRAAARVSILGEPRFVLFATRRLTCTGCGFTRDWAQSIVTCPNPESGLDWYFRAPFYFQIPCAGHRLWVANREHLEFLRGYVAAKHRARSGRGWSNKSLASRLPKWMSAAKNRIPVLKALAELEQRMRAYEARVMD